MTNGIVANSKSFKVKQIYIKYIQIDIYSWLCHLQDVLLSKSHNLTNPQFPYLQSRHNNNSYFKGLYEDKISCLTADFLGSSDGKASVHNVGDLSSIPGFDPWVGEIPWRRKWHPTPILLPRKPRGRRSLVPMGSQSGTRPSDLAHLPRQVDKNTQYCGSAVAQSCPTLWDPADCSLPVFSAHGIFPARILEGVLFLPPGSPLDPGIKGTSSVSLALQADSLPLSYLLWKPIKNNQ